MRIDFATLIRGTLLVLSAALFVPPVSAQTGFPGSIALGAGNGTVTYRYTVNTGSCRVGKSTDNYEFTIYDDFVYVNAQGVQTPWSGYLDIITGSPGNEGGAHCPPNTPAEPGFVLLGNGYEVAVYYTGSRGVLAGIYASATSGYINPKYVVVSVIYSPPGSKSSVSYTGSTTVSNTSSTTSTFSSSTTQSVSLTATGAIFSFLSGSETLTESSTLTQSSQNSSSVTATVTTSSGLTVPGPASDYIGVDHDYDLIKIWINSVMLYTVYDTSSPYALQLAWNGYGSSALDPTAPIDIVDVPVGCLNGDFPATETACATPLGQLQRTWAASENWPSGEGPALTQTDLNTILAADPWGSCTPSLPVGSSACPTYSTPGFVLLPPEFTLSDQTNVPYSQPLPGDQPSTNTYSVSTTTSTTQGQGSTSTYSQTFGVEDAFTGTAWLAGFSAKVSVSQTLSWTYQQNYLLTQANTSTGTATITGPACAGNPCNPAYPPTALTYGTGTAFDIFQDTFFGTFVFVPSAYN